MASGVAYRSPDLGYHSLTIGQFHLLHETLLNLDYTTLNNLRLVNRTARRVVESIPAYSLLRTHALDTLRVMDAAKCSGYFAIGDLFEELCHPWCRTCPDLEFGPLLYLPTLTRSCVKCNIVRREYQPGLVKNICYKYAISDRDINNKAHPLPVIRTIPNVPPFRPRSVADVGQALALAMRIHGSPKAVKRACRSREKADRKAHERAVKKWDRDRDRRATPAPRRPRAPHKRPASLRSGEQADNWRFRATVALPYLDRKMQTVETGVYCRACTYHWEEGTANEWKGGPWVLHPHPPTREARFRAFLEKDIPAHFAVCKNVDRGYDFSERRLDSWGREADGEDFFVFPEDGE
ncbi:hypothetical protein BJY00DRAFT_327340 [Aspergillus carlsbadensis]|nr:hypothetical protein BJY00DRAFT_327340 [Aspergillus carlsbadensis]